MKKEEIIKEISWELDEANSWGNSYGCQFEWYTLAKVLGLDIDIEAKCKEFGCEPWDGVDFYDDKVEAWIRSVTDRNYNEIQNETFDLALEWEAESLVDEGYILDKQKQIVYASDEEWESLEKWEGSYEGWLNERAKLAWIKNLKEKTCLDLTGQEIEYLVEECNVGGYDEVSLEEACDLATSLHSIVEGRFEEFIARFGSDYRLSDESVKEDWDSAEEAYKELLKITNSYSKKLRGCKVQDSEWEDIKGLLANREMDCGILGVSECYASLEEIAEFFVELFGMKNAVEKGIIDLAEVCRTRGSKVVLWDIDELASELQND